MNHTIEKLCFKQTVSVENIRSHIEALEGERHPLTSFEALEYSADYIMDTLRSFGYDVADHYFRSNDRPFRNIIATRRGWRQPDERIIVMAHFDTVEGTPGADDNASGVAVMLETARILMSMAPKRTIHFIGVNLEENETPHDPDSGTRGSHALAAYARENRWDIAAVVVLESVAYAGEGIVQTIPPHVTIPVPEIGNFIAIVGNRHSTQLTDAFSRAVDQHKIDLPLLTLVVPENGEILPDSRRSDHAPFWDAGYKAIMVTDTTNFRSPHYHRSSDTLATLNLQFASHVCHATARAVLELADSPEHTQCPRQPGV